MSAAAQRILTAAAEQLAVHGPARLSMQDVAEAAEVSKGLIHYHFHDKETLLARVAEWVTQDSVAREREALRAGVVPGDGFAQFGQARAGGILLRALGHRAGGGGRERGRRRCIGKALTEVDRAEAAGKAGHVLEHRDGHPGVDRIEASVGHRVAR